MSGDQAHAGVPKRILLLECRNLGDAVIGTGLIEALGLSQRKFRIDVLTRPEIASLYADNPHVDSVFTASFPMGIGRRFSLLGLLRLTSLAIALRRRRYDRVVNLVGDFRENLLGSLISPAGNCAVQWAEGSGQSKNNRGGLMRTVRYPVSIPAAEENIYGAIELVAAHLGATAPARPRVYRRNGVPYLHSEPPKGTNVVGIHMSATVPWRHWPFENWRLLVPRLRLAGVRVVVFGAASERSLIIDKLAGSIDDGVDFVTGTFYDFFEQLTRLRAVICLDSFGTHAAHAIGAPSLFLSGPNSSLFCPPSALMVEGGPGLACYPCYCRPTCLSSKSPFACMSEITVERVIQALHTLGVPCA